jgi:ADP-L-glycero-D-manno-heptose 6-epimerase
MIVVTGGAGFIGSAIIQELNIRERNDLAQNIFKAMGREPTIEYIPMPEAIIGQYQYHTCAEIKKIRNFGYTQTVMSLEESVSDYIENYLVPNRRLAS